MTKRVTSWMCSAIRSVFTKSALSFLFTDGLALASEMKNDGKRVFLDMKFLDIGNTVEKAVAAVAESRLRFSDHSRHRQQNHEGRRQRPRQCAA